MKLRTLTCPRAVLMAMAALLFLLAPGTPAGAAPQPPVPAAPAATCTMPFTDIDSSQYFYGAVNFLYCRHVISGYADGTFRWYNTTTRAQAAKMFVLSHGWWIDTVGGPHFGDVAPTDWFYGYVETAYNRGVMRGYAGGAFLPGQNITRAEFAYGTVQSANWTRLHPVSPHFADVPADHPYYDVIEAAAAKGIISGYDCGTQPGEDCDSQRRPYFRPAREIVRGQLSKLLNLELNDWLSIFNQSRTAVRLPLVAEDASLAPGVNAHLNYMLLNIADTNHTENPALPGYTAAGNLAAQQSNLYRFNLPVTTTAPGAIQATDPAAPDAMQEWMENNYHRYGLLRSELRRSQFAIGCRNVGTTRYCAGVLNILAGLDGPATLTNVAYPADGQQGLNTRLITWQFQPVNSAAEMVTLTSATLRDAQGRAVPFTTAASTIPYFNMLSIIPNAALAAGTTYTVEVYARQGSTTLHKVWSFGTN